MYNFFLVNIMCSGVAIAWEAADYERRIFINLRFLAKYEHFYWPVIRINDSCKWKLPAFRAIVWAFSVSKYLNLSNKGEVVFL